MAFDAKMCIVAIGLMLFFNFSPMLLIVVLVCSIGLMANRTSSSGNEQVAPVHEAGVTAGLGWGASAIQGRRPYMEDMFQVAGFAGTKSHLVTEQVGLSHFFAVFDGHGGKRAAVWAHKHLISNVLAKLSETFNFGAGNGDCAALLDDACVEGFLATDNEFLRFALDNSFPDGSTAVCCLLQRTLPNALRRILVANVGDSRCALVRRDGSAVALSQDHKPNRPDERARVEEAGGQVIFAGCWRVQGDLAVSRAFGDMHLKRYGVTARPELTSFTLYDDDVYLILASDGLWDVVDEQQCANTVLRANDPKMASRNLCELATALGSMDNITALVVDLRSG